MKHLCEHEQLYLSVFGVRNASKVNYNLKIILRYRLHTLASVAQLIGHHPVKRKVTSLIPGRDNMPGLRV